MDVYDDRIVYNKLFDYAIMQINISVKEPTSREKEKYYVYDEFKKREC